MSICEIESLALKLWSSYHRNVRITIRACHKYTLNVDRFGKQIRGYYGPSWIASLWETISHSYRKKYNMSFVAEKVREGPELRLVDILTLYAI